PEHTPFAPFQVKVFHAVSGIGVIPGPPAGDVVPEFLERQCRREIYGHMRVRNIVLREAFDSPCMNSHGSVLVAVVKLGPSAVCSRRNSQPRGAGPMILA